MSVGNLLFQEGTAFRFPVKVHLISPFTGENCYVGSDEHPIVVEFTTGKSGALQGRGGFLAAPSEGEMLEESGDVP